MERYCALHRIAIDHFVQGALFDRLEELEDLDHLKQIRHEPTRRLAEVLKELKLPRRHARRADNDGRSSRFSLSTAHIASLHG